MVSRNRDGFLPGKRSAFSLVTLPGSLVVDQFPAVEDQYRTNPLDVFPHFFQSGIFTITVHLGGGFCCLGLQQGVLAHCNSVWLFSRRFQAT